ncbi:MAG: SEC-C metal-binding domain-containing protein [Phycisphaerales bacterium]
MHKDHGFFNEEETFQAHDKRRYGYPSETALRGGDQVVHGNKELIEKLGRNDPCPCGSGRRF